jgi:hypothetical protein
MTADLTGKQLRFVQECLVDTCATQAALVRDACAAGTRFVWRRYPGLDHGATANASLADSLPFARSVLAGEVVASVTSSKLGASWTA